MPFTLFTAKNEPQYVEYWRMIDGKRTVEHTLSWDALQRQFKDAEKRAVQSVANNTMEIENV